MSIQSSQIPVMNRFIKIIIRLNILLFCLNIINVHAAKKSNPNYQTESESFSIPGNGELIMDVPKVWNYNFTVPGNNQPPIITFYNLDKDKEEIYQLNLSVLWDNSFGRNILSPKYIYSLVEKTGKQALIYSDQSELILEEITGQNGIGYWFNLSDSTAGSGEYKYLTQGALAVGELLLIFSLFSNENESILQEALLKIIMSAQHQYRKDV